MESPVFKEFINARNHMIQCSYKVIQCLVTDPSNNHEKIKELLKEFQEFYENDYETENCRRCKLDELFHMICETEVLKLYPNFNEILDNVMFQIMQMNFLVIQLSELNELDENNSILKSWLLKHNAGVLMSFDKATQNCNLFNIIGQSSKDYVKDTAVEKCVDSDAQIYVNEIYELNNHEENSCKNIDNVENVDNLSCNYDNILPSIEEVMNIDMYIFKFKKCICENIIFYYSYGFCMLSSDEFKKKLFPFDRGKSVIVLSKLD